MNKKIKITYSIGARLAGGGIGNTAYHAVRGYHRNQMLDIVLCGTSRNSELPATKIQAMGILSRLIRKIASYDNSNQIDYFYRLLYDQWAEKQIQNLDVFHGWSGYNLSTLKKANQLGAITFLDRALAHPNQLTKYLSKEYRQWGVKFKWPSTANFVKEEIKSADFIFIPSDFVRSTFLQEGVPESKLIQIPFGVNINKFTPKPKMSTHSKFIALFVGQVSIRKGVHLLLEAWNQLKWKKAELWLAGQLSLPKNMLKKYKSIKNIRFLGHVKDIVAIYKKSDVFVFPSLVEGSALVTYEAMACGLPVITTFNAGSVMRDQKDGFIIEYGNIEEISARLDQLRINGKLRRQMGKSARNYIEEFTWYKYGERLSKAIEDKIQK